DVRLRRLRVQHQGALKMADRSFELPRVSQGKRQGSLRGKRCGRAVRRANEAFERRGLRLGGLLLLFDADERRTHADGRDPITPSEGGLRTLSIGVAKCSSERGPSPNRNKLVA